MSVINAGRSSAPMSRYQYPNNAPLPYLTQEDEAAWARSDSTPPWAGSTAYEHEGRTTLVWNPNTGREEAVTAWDLAAYSNARWRGETSDSTALDANPKRVSGTAATTAWLMDHSGFFDWATNNSVDYARNVRISKLPRGLTAAELEEQSRESYVRPWKGSVVAPAPVPAPVVTTPQAAPVGGGQAAVEAGVAAGPDVPIRARRAPRPAPPSLATRGAGVREDEEDAELRRGGLRRLGG